MSTPRTTRRKAFYSGVVLFLMGCCALVLAEVAYSRAIHVIVVEIEDRLRKQFREPQAVHIACVGDSYTEGMLSESGLGWCDFLPAALAERGFPLPVEALNFGLSGSPSDNHFSLAAAIMERSAGAPDFLTVTSGANNLTAWTLNRRFLEEDEGSDSIPLWVRSAYRLPRSTFWGFEMLLRPVRTPWEFDAQHVESHSLSRVWMDNAAYLSFVQGYMAGELAPLLELAKASSTEVLVGSYHFGVDADAAFLVEANNRGVPVFDLVSHNLKDRFFEEGWLTEDEWHPNDAGNAYIAGRWADWFLAEVWSED